MCPKPGCGKQFKKASYYEHVSSKHPELCTVREHNFECLICNKMFSSKQSRWNHKRSCKGKARDPPKIAVEGDATIDSNWGALRALHFKTFGHEPNVVLMDPPWDIGIAKGKYPSIGDNKLELLKIGELIQRGYLFMWVVNSKEDFGHRLLKSWGFRHCETVVWVKLDEYGNKVNGIGHDLRHSKELCLVGKKGSERFCRSINNRQVIDDVIHAMRREHSRKPDEMYELVESFLPGRGFIEIFGRGHNLRKGWLTFGNEVVPRSPSEDDQYKYVRLEVR